MVMSLHWFPAVALLVIWIQGTLGMPLHAQSEPAPDTSDVSESSWFVLPNVFYTPETDLAGGVVAGYIMYIAPESYPSSLLVSAIVTRNRQFLLGLKPELYTSENRSRYAAEIGFQEYPDLFYGLGPDAPESAEESYTARRFFARLFVERAAWENFRLGLRYSFYYERIKDIEEGGLLDLGQIPGRMESRLSGFGVTIVYDTRDNLYYPRRGSYVEAFALAHTRLTGSRLTMRRFVVNARTYTSVHPDHILVAQAYGEAVAGTVPFTVLPLLGGNELLRGYLEGRFRDDVVAIVQGAYRFPLFWRFRGELFAGAGNVAERLNALELKSVKAAAGAGIRFRLNPEDLHVRMDFAIGSEGGAVYITIGEAF